LSGAIVLYAFTCVLCIKKLTTYFIYLLSAYIIEIGYTLHKLQVKSNVVGL